MIELAIEFVLVPDIRDTLLSMLLYDLSILQLISHLLCDQAYRMVKNYHLIRFESLLQYLLNTLQF